MPKSWPRIRRRCRPRSRPWSRIDQSPAAEAAALGDERALAAYSRYFDIGCNDEGFAFLIRRRPRECEQLRIVGEPAASTRQAWMETRLTALGK